MRNPLLALSAVKERSSSTSSPKDVYGIYRARAGRQIAFSFSDNAKNEIAINSSGDAVKARERESIRRFMRDARASIRAWN